MQPINVYLVRHGQTIFNIYHRMQGWANSPLTEKGVSDAQNAGKLLANVDFKHVYSSDVMRAMQTAHVIMKANQAITVNKIELNPTPFFREAYYGYFEGEDIDVTWKMVGLSQGMLTLNELLSKFSLDEIKTLMHEADPSHRAELPEHYWQRINDGFNLIRQESKPGDNVLLVSHSMTIRSIVERFDTEHKFDVTKNPRNGSVTKLAVTPENIKVKYYDHLDNI
ncbi:MAG: histidine phosphatase family protein [Candidatus Paralactobacillus gallistercoris]|uniref:Histidine phosphatase family protein n=1 Tax=Candidatus Paralactobacillus gallistercoris TaxID=2838724 RepID=A0A948TIM0_9LACO|nr:histidine phosphatase family protein [Candidatus Paralactobacillus gallistercoris]